MRLSRTTSRTSLFHVHYNPRRNHVAPDSVGTRHLSGAITIGKKIRRDAHGGGDHRRLFGFHDFRPDGPDRLDDAPEQRPIGRHLASTSAPSEPRRKRGKQASILRFSSRMALARQGIEPGPRAGTAFGALLSPAPRFRPMRRRCPRSCRLPECLG